MAITIIGAMCLAINTHLVDNVVTSPSPPPSQVIDSYRINH